jgi:hypothetical protein
LHHLCLFIERSHLALRKIETGRRKIDHFGGVGGVVADPFDNARYFESGDHIPEVIGHWCSQRDNLNGKTINFDRKRIYTVIGLNYVRCSFNIKVSQGRIGFGNCDFNEPAHFRNPSAEQPNIIIKRFDSVINQVELPHIQLDASNERDIRDSVGNAVE